MKTSRKRCGLLGRRLAHSDSPRIHALLGDYEYRLYEKEPEELADFLRSGEFAALNVTIPYKRAVIPFCAELSPCARAIGSVNTLLRCEDGTLFGDNTDAAGFDALLDELGIPLAGKKALVLGSGGASRTVCHVLRNRGALPVVISRSGKDNYENIDRHADARLIVNATPVGMFPDCDSLILDPARFEKLEAAADLIYNPLRTPLLERAGALGLPCANGLLMLTEQARAASERFTGVTIPKERSAEICRKLRAENTNIVLIGMPGCGKSSIARALGQFSGRRVIDADAEIEAICGISPAELIRTRGETAFRDVEAEILRRLGRERGIILATGGGCVEREENRELLRRNGWIVRIERDLALLPKDDRPISQQTDLNRLYEHRAPLYAHFADGSVRNDTTVNDAAKRILEAFHETSGD